MKELLDQVFDELRSAWRFRWFGMALALLVAVVGWFVVFTLPDKFEAQASIFVDTRTALKPVLQGLTVEQDVNVQLNYVRQALLSGDSLEDIALKSGVLSAQDVDPQKKAGTLRALSEQVLIEVRSASGRESDRESAGSIYSFRYQDKSREGGLRVIDTVLKTFVEDTLGGKREGAEHAHRFLEEQIKGYEERLRFAENRLAEFKKTHIGLIPTERGDYFAQLQAEIDAERKTQNDLTVATTRRAELARQIRGESVITAGGSNSAAGAANSANDTSSRIRETQGRIDDLLLRFTDKHPDVIAAKDNLAELRRRRDAEVESLRRGDPGAAALSGVSANPVYQNIQLQLNQADVEIASLRGQLLQHRDKATELRQRLDSAPQVEAEFAQLNRDYDINKAQYTALLSNYEKARLGERADSAGSVRFEVVQPPMAAYGPVSPNRTLLTVGVLVAALAAGGLLCYVMNLVRPIVASTRELELMVPFPLLGVVSPAFPRQLQAQARSDATRFAAALGALLILGIVVLVSSQYGVRLAVGQLTGS